MRLGWMVRIDDEACRPRENGGPIVPKPRTSQTGDPRKFFHNENQHRSAITTKQRSYHHQRIQLRARSTITTWLESRTIPRLAGRAPRRPEIRSYC